jgi:hypothetical protein
MLLSVDEIARTMQSDVAGLLGSFQKSAVCKIAPAPKV